MKDAVLLRKTSRALVKVLQSSAGIRSRTTHYFFAPDKETIARELLKHPDLAASFVCSEGYPTAAYQRFKARHPGLGNDYNLSGDAFMTALRGEQPADIIELLCEFDGDNEHEGRYVEMTELKHEHFLDRELCVRVACARRRLVTQALRNKGLGVGTCDWVARLLWNFVCEAPVGHIAMKTKRAKTEPRPVLNLNPKPYTYIRST